jgi:hypothetical protein
MDHRKIKLNEIIDKSLNKKIVLPNFQRNFVWNAERQKKYITSIFLDLSAGSFLSLDGHKDDFKARQLCKDLSIVPADDCKYLLDGQQRCSTIVNTFSNVYKDNEGDNWLSIYDDTFYHLQNRFVIALDSDFFGYEKLRFQRNINYDDISFFSDNLKHYQLYKKDISKQYHPGYWPKENGSPIDESKRKLNIINYFSDLKELPLYYLHDTKNFTSIIAKVINFVAVHKQNELSVVINKKNAKEYLGHFEYDENNFTEQIKQDLLVTLRVEWVTAVKTFFENKLNIELHEIFLLKNEASKAITIFETINQPGAPLTEYDLLVAKSSRLLNKENLNQKLCNLLIKQYSVPKSISNSLLDFPSKYKFNPEDFGAVDDKSPSSNIKYHFSKLLSILKIGNLDELTLDDLKRDKILSLTPEDIKNFHEKAIISIVRASMFFHFRLGVVNLKNISYNLMLIPIAVALSVDNNWKNKKIINKIEFWYWSSIFSGHYRDYQNKKSFDDIKILNKFLKNKINLNDRKEKIFEAQDYCSLKSLTNVDVNEKAPASIQNSIMQFILSRQPKDLNVTKNDSYRLNSWDIARKIDIDFDNNGDVQALTVEDHHIVPLANASTLKESAKDLRKKPHLLNSCLNRTYISKYSNRKISNFTPEKYFNETTGISLIEHCLPANFHTEYVRKPNEDEIVYYNRILDQRYNRIYEKVVQLLDRL